MNGASDDVDRAVRRAIAATEQAAEDASAAALLIKVAARPDKVIMGRMLDLQEALDVIMGCELDKLKGAMDDF